MEGKSECRPKPEQEEYDEVCSFCHDFFRHYYTERSPEKVLEMVSDSVICIGLKENEVTQDAGSFEDFMRLQMESVPNALNYTVVQYGQHACGGHQWISFARVRITVQVEHKVKSYYNLRVTLTVRRDEERGRWLFEAIHVSESVDRERKDELEAAATLRVRQKRAEEPYSREVHMEMGELLCHLFPGGIITNYAEEGYPLVIANGEFLRLTGYSSIREYREATGGCFARSIHPEDLEKYNYNIRFLLNTEKQCECDYRLRRKDGSYLWVHNVGRRAGTSDGRDAVINSLTDISDQMAEQQRLEIQSEIDELTGICNRKGGRRLVDEALQERDPSDRWLFCIMDLDNFKLVNDLYGHQQGDTTLRYCARQLDLCFQNYGTAFRLGGDEFAVFLPHYSDLNEVELWLRQLCENYAHFAQVNCPDAGTSMSIGGVYGTGNQAPEWMYQRADEVLYQIKNNGKGRVELAEASDR